MIQKGKQFLSCTSTYLRQFQKGKTYDYPSFMRKYIDNYLKCHWKPPCKRKLKARTSRDAFSNTNSMSSITRSNNSKLPSIDMQSKNSTNSFNVFAAMSSSTDDDSTISDDVIPKMIEIVRI